MNKNNLLIVDDDNYTIELYNMIVEWSEYKPNIKTELSALKAMDYLREAEQTHSENFPDYILLDLRMPEMHGFDFIREFEKRFPQRINKTNIIITTSSVIQKEKNEAFKFESVKEYLVKPIPADYIEKLVTAGLESQPQL